jgi:prenyl protein peptidase
MDGLAQPCGCMSVKVGLPVLWMLTGVQGPITEEVLYRSASVPLMLVARASIKQTIFLSPLIFGVSHFHHFYEFRISNPEVPVIAAVARSIFQLAYTTLFGAYATFLYVRNGSLLGVCMVHTFCNSMGLPRLWGLVRRDTPTATDGKEPALQPAGSLAWSVPYYVLLFSGVFLFYQHFWTLTESNQALIPTQAFSRSTDKRSLVW